jgi:His-Xaa-Ser system radical SAM maturase HxsC
MIPLQAKGIPLNIFNPIIGIIKNDLWGKDLIVDNYVKDRKIILSPNSIADSQSIGVFRIEIDYLRPGDVVVLFPDGVVNTLFRINSEDNIIFMTNNCNQNCIMCSQPPQKNNDLEFYFNINSSLIDFIPLSIKQICITGGEPTLCGKYLKLVLIKLFNRIPDINVFILTNAVLLSDTKYFEYISGLPQDKILFSVPIYGDNQFTHDSIVGTKGSFNKTLKGIYNLFKYGFRVELRVIPQKNNIIRLEKLAQFIYKNLTFVENVAFMELENIGKAQTNIENIWISPELLNFHLNKSTDFLTLSGIRCSLYNFQNCVLPIQLRHISLQTISDWKKEYLPECSECIERNVCGGIFASSLNMMKEYIKPIKNENPI